MCALVLGPPRRRLHRDLAHSSRSHLHRNCIGATELRVPTSSISDGPGDYRPGLACSWRVRVAASLELGLPTAIRLVFEALDTEYAVDTVKASYAGRARGSPAAPPAGCR